MSQLPPQVQERLLRFQQLQRNLQTVLAQKQQVELEMTETEQALAELGSLTEEAVIYKSIGSLLVKAQKEKVVVELEERKDLLETRVKVLTKQEERLRGQFSQLQAKLKRDLGTGPETSAAP
ncbi:MAG: prefoldin subunit beta [Candidatus Bathyarchaeota archaeon]|nr:MAG: prefoldin subunit beta [Candidatus Bathyarchaeota archaeon]